MINVSRANKFCCEDITLIENYDEAINSQEPWDIHHKIGLYFDKQWLIDNGFYYDQRSEMLVFLPHGEHSSLHNTGHKISDGQKRALHIAHKGKKLSDETKQKMSEARIGEKNHMFGKQHSEETKRKISKARKGKAPWNKGGHLSEEQKHKLSEAHRGKQLTEEQKQKISKKVLQFSKDGGFIAEYKSAVEANKKTGVNKLCISFCCNGKYKSAGGFIWKFKL